MEFLLEYISPPIIKLNGGARRPVRFNPDNPVEVAIEPKYYNIEFTIKMVSSGNMDEFEALNEVGQSNLLIEKINKALSELQL